MGKSITLTEAELAKVVQAAVAAALSAASPATTRRTARKATPAKRTPAKTAAAKPAAKPAAKATGTKALSRGHIKTERAAGASWVKGKTVAQLQGRADEGNVPVSVLKKHGYHRPTGARRNAVNEWKAAHSA